VKPTVFVLYFIDIDNLLFLADRVH